MKVIDAARLIDEVQDTVSQMLEMPGVKITKKAEDERDNNGELTGIVGSITISPESDPELEVYLNVAACVEENGEIDDEMLCTELNGLKNTAEDYKARLMAHTDKAEAVREIDNLVTTGLDLAAERRAAEGRAKIYRIAAIVAAALLAASTIWRLVDLIIR